MQQVGRRMARILAMTGTLTFVTAGSLFAADAPSESQLQRLMETAAHAPDAPDHDYVSNSLQSMLKQSKDLQLSPQQTDKIKAISEQYERTKRDREQAYKQSEMDALKLIHDSRSSLFAIENAVQKADQEAADGRHQGPAGSPRRPAPGAIRQLAAGACGAADGARQSASGTG